MDDRVSALEQAVAVQDEAIVILGNTVRALFALNLALMTRLADSDDRAAVCEQALSLLPNEAARPAAALVELLTREPSELAIDPALSDALSRLH